MVYDFLVIGAGISGAAAAHELAVHGSTCVLEAEAQAGYHSTGRSAALYTPHYGPELVRLISQLSHDFLSKPPASFTPGPLLQPRGMMTVASSDHWLELTSREHQLGDWLELIDARQTLALAPFLRPDRVAGALLERGVFDMDVSALHHGFLAGLKQRGGKVSTNAHVVAIERQPSNWQVHTRNDVYEARVLVNASGAWADQVAELAGAAPVGLQPRRRTAILVSAAAGLSLDTVPAMDFVGVDNYIKPEAGKLMVSPGDATAVAAQDIQPDDLDVAELIHWLGGETLLDADRPEHQWAGLRSFVDDGLPVVGFDPRVPDFFWLAAQGGYGIMMSSALGRATAGLIVEGTLPADFLDRGISSACLGVRTKLPQSAGDELF